MYEGMQNSFFPLVFSSSSHVLLTHLSKVSAVHLCSSSDLATVSHFYLKRSSIRHWGEQNLIWYEEQNGTKGDGSFSSL